MTNSQTAVSTLETINTQMLSSLEETLGDAAEVMLPELAIMYLEDTSPMLQELIDAANNQDATQLIKSAHTIRGSSSSMGLHAFSRLCQKVETAAKTNMLNDIDNLLLHVQAEFEQITKVLQTYATSIA